MDFFLRLSTTGYEFGRALPTGVLSTLWCLGPVFHRAQPLHPYPAMFSWSFWGFFMFHTPVPFKRLARAWGDCSMSISFWRGHLSLEFLLFLAWEVLTLQWAPCSLCHKCHLSLGWASPHHYTTLTWHITMFFNSCPCMTRRQYLCSFDCQKAIMYVHRTRHSQVLFHIYSFRAKVLIWRAVCWVFH